MTLRHLYHHTLNRIKRHYELRGEYDSIYGLNFEWQHTVTGKHDFDQMCRTVLENRGWPIELMEPGDAAELIKAMVDYNENDRLRTRHNSKPGIWKNN